MGFNRTWIQEVFIHTENNYTNNKADHLKGKYKVKESNVATLQYARVGIELKSKDKNTALGYSLLVHIPVSLIKSPGVQKPQPYLFITSWGVAINLLLLHLLS